jgi:hypothetical protein
MRSPSGSEIQRIAAEVVRDVAELRVVIVP